MIDLVGILVSKFGGLGCHLTEEGRGKSLIDGLKKDSTQTMFEPALPGPSPLAEYGSRQVEQMIDVWFSTHPLSFLVSKTLQINSLRAETYDEVLLAVMLADANLSIGDDVAIARSRVLLRWATAHLHKNSVALYQSAAQSTTSQRS